MDNLTALPPATNIRLSAMGEAEKERTLSAFIGETNRLGFCDWLSYAFIRELRKN